MFKKNIVSFLVSLGVLSSFAALPPAFAGSALKCQPPVLSTDNGSDKMMAGYLVVCDLPATANTELTVTFTGKIPAGATPPYIIKASYLLDVREGVERKLGLLAREDQLAGGLLHSAASSLAALPMQFDAQTSWDAASNVFSVEERAGIWHSYSIVQRLDPLAVAASAGLAPGEFLVAASVAGVVDAGLSSVPVKNSRATLNLVLGDKYSRFAGKKADTPLVVAHLGLRDGKLEFLLGESRVQNQATIQDALNLLDRKPADIARAWGLASRAQILGLTDEVAYAEQKVAAHNPQLLREFQEGVKRIQPYSLNP